MPPPWKSFRGKSQRMPGWDYSKNGHYFLTWCTYQFAPLLGEIVNGEMILSDFGKIAEDEWLRSFDIRKELILDEFTIMPNHMHAIVILYNLNEEQADEAPTEEQEDNTYTHITQEINAYTSENLGNWSEEEN